ncbi:response regulator [Botrimarina sp.]|uniref:response regulator n=1 Tax=Botrimarina sp. TaxID=2795802 RepID=UPI0032EAEC94
MTDSPVLIVDDDPTLLASLQRCLSSEFAVRTAASGFEALGTIADGGRFSVVLTDMRMPGIGGLDFISRARQLDDRLQFVVLTGSQDAARLRSVGPDDAIHSVLTKPTNPARIVEAIRSAQSRRLQPVDGLPAQPQLP